MNLKWSLDTGRKQVFILEVRLQADSLLILSFSNKNGLLLITEIAKVNFTCAANSLIQFCSPCLVKNSYPSQKSINSLWALISCKTKVKWLYLFTFASGTELLIPVLGIIESILWILLEKKVKGKLISVGRTTHSFCAILLKWSSCLFSSRERFVLWFHRSKSSCSVYSVSISLCKTTRSQLWKQNSQLLKLSSSQDITQKAKALLTFNLGSVRLMWKDPCTTCG